MQKRTRLELLSAGQVIRIAVSFHGSDFLQKLYGERDAITTFSNSGLPDVDVQAEDQNRKRRTEVRPIIGDLNTGNQSREDASLHDSKKYTVSSSSCTW